jgi:hypothetical protein
MSHENTALLKIQVSKMDKKPGYGEPGQKIKDPGISIREELKEP